jgi:hypothetical protein
VGKKRRIEIRIRTRQTLIAERAASITRGWCAECGEQVEMIRMEKAAALNPESLLRSGIQVSAEKIHLIEMADSSLLVCLNSLLE